MRFAGEQTNTARFFAASNALALTSREDPFPTINLEALAAGIPVVAFEGAGGAAEALTGDAGITVPYLDVQTMASVLVRLANSSSEASAIGRRAREQFCANFTYDQYYGRFLDLIEREFGALR
jgi:glycosyltransferase involved in cell wall biosynthesis